MKKNKSIFKSKKFRMIFIVVMLALIAGLCFLYYKLSDKSIAVETAKVKVATVKQYYDTTGTLISGAEKDFELYEGVLVKEVKVKPGDTVKEGDVIATFDTSSMNSIIAEKKKALNTATENYNNSTEQIAELQSNPSSGNAETLTAEQVEAIVNAAGELTDAQKAALTQQLGNYNQPTNSQMPSAVKDSYKQAMNLAREEYNTAVAEKKELDKGFVAEKAGKIVTVNIKAGEKYEYVAPESNNSSIMSILSGSSAQTTSDVSSIVSNVLSNNSTGDSARKGIAVIVDYYDGYKVEFSLGKYDVQKIDVGMTAIVEYTDFKYNAVVSSKSARAETSGGDLSSLTSSMMGGSSSSSSSTGGVRTEATITNPDDKLVIGFDTKISILTAEHKKVLTIPVESLIIDEGKKYVYTIGKNMTAKKTLVETDASSETVYEVTKGLKEGDTVIVNASKVSDGTPVHVGEK